MSTQQKVKRLFCIGDANVPESLVAGNNDSEDIGEQPPTHPHLDAIWKLSDDTGRMYFAINNDEERSSAKFAGFPAGTYAGLYALKHATIGGATQGMHPALKHIGSLDQCFPGDVHVLAVAAGSKSSVMLLSTGIMVALSRDPAVHGTVIQLPESAIDKNTGEFARVLSVAAGETHFACCDDHGRLYTWGWGNEYGQLGDGSLWSRDESKIDIHEPKRVGTFGVEDAIGSTPDVVAANEANNLQYSVIAQAPPPAIASVACGKHHTLLLTVRNNAVYSFGRNHRGQLGHGVGPKTPGPKLGAAPSPKVVQIAFGAKIVQVAASGEAHHSLLLLGSGKVLGFGENTTGAIGTGTTADAKTPVGATFVSISEDGAPAAAHTAAPSKSPRTAAYGTPNSFCNPKRIPKIDEDRGSGDVDVKSIATSATHTVLVTAQDNSAVYSAGLRPIRGPPGAIQHVDAYGALGRLVNNKKDALSFGPVVQRTMLPSAKLSTQQITTALCGSGFSALVDENAGSISVHGTISVNGKVCFGSGLKQEENEEVDESERDDTAAVQLGLGPTGKLVGAFTAKGGLLLLVESDS